MANRLWFEACKDQPLESSQQREKANFSEPSDFMYRFPGFRREGALFPRQYEAQGTKKLLAEFVVCPLYPGPNPVYNLDLNYSMICGTQTSMVPAVPLSVLTGSAGPSQESGKDITPETNLITQRRGLFLHIILGSTKQV